MKFHPFALATTAFFTLLSSGRGGISLVLATGDVDDADAADAENDNLKNEQGLWLDTSGGAKVDGVVHLRRGDNGGLTATTAGRTTTTTTTTFAALRYSSTTSTSGLVLLRSADEEEKNEEDWEGTSDHPTAGGPPAADEDRPFLIDEGGDGEEASPTTRRLFTITDVGFNNSFTGWYGDTCEAYCRWVGDSGIPFDKDPRDGLQYGQTFWACQTSATTIYGPSVGFSTMKCNGLCKDLMNDPQNCGYCGSVCSAAPNRCLQGSCVPKDTGYPNRFTGWYGDTCEAYCRWVGNSGIPFDKDPRDGLQYGQTFWACQTSATTIYGPSVGFSTMKCNGLCKDLMNDPQNCGRCGTVCDHLCCNGQCKGLCDPQNCGACGKVCSSGENCAHGTCVPRVSCFTTMTGVRNAVDKYMSNQQVPTYGNNLNNWCFGPDVKDFQHLFSSSRNSQATTFNTDISCWDVSRITDFYGMFLGASEFNKPLNDWDVSNGERFEGMFARATNFNQPLNDWNVSKGYTFSWMFEKASAFNQPLHGWDVSNAQIFESMFGFASAFNGNIASWNVSKAHTFKSMFYQAAAFNQPLQDWDVSRVSVFSMMFAYATSFNGNIAPWNVSNGDQFDYMFTHATSFSQDLSSWDLPPGALDYMFLG